VISYFQAVVLGLLQGFSELFPISSLGHSVVLPKLLGWNIQQSDKFFLNFLVATHLATALVLLGFFWRDWLRIVQGIGRSLRDRGIAADDPDAKLGWLIVVATIPAGLLGLLLEGSLRDLFKSAESAAAFLIANGLLLYGAERLRRRPPRPDDWKGDSDARIAKLTWRQAIGVGAAQAIALVPGLSRSGASMGGGLLVGLSNEDAARFSFLLATPIIGAAAVLKLPELVGKGGHVIGTAVVGAACAAVTAYISVRFLLKYFETNTLTPFAIYCVVAGTLLTIGFALT
jgi:undecaprenyl-diphosphatase